MKTLLLDYERVRSRADALTGAGILMLGLAALAGACAWYVEGARDLSGVRAQIEELRLMAKRSSGRVQAAPGDTPEVRAEVARANTVLAQLNFPWLGLLDAIESTRGDRVALLSVTPEARQQTVRIGAEAKAMGDVLAYVRRLAARPEFGNVHLVSHEIAREDRKGRAPAVSAVRFNVSAEWRPVQ